MTRISPNKILTMSMQTIPTVKTIMSISSKIALILTIEFSNLNLTRKFWGKRMQPSRNLIRGANRKFNSTSHMSMSTKPGHSSLVLPWVGNLAISRFEFITFYREILKFLKSGEWFVTKVSIVYFCNPVF